MSRPLSRTQLAAVIADMAAEHGDERRLAKAIAGYLVSERQTKQLDAVLRDVISVRARRGIVEARITTAHPLTAATRQKVKAKIQQAYPTANQIIIDEQQRPEVLSGIAIQTHNKQLDETAHTKLTSLRNSIKG